jgi:Sec-independent protein translocase protein TatA
VNGWVALAIVVLVALVIFLPSAEPARRAERLIRAWRRDNRTDLDEGEPTGERAAETSEPAGEIERG